LETVDVESPIIAGSAHNHGISDSDMLHARRNPTGVDYHDNDNDDGDDFIMYYGPDFAGNPLEVGVVVADDGVEVIVHAWTDQRLKKR
jgi:hypothetical protein